MSNANTLQMQREIIRTCHAGLDSTTLRSEVIRLLGKAIHIDLSFFATMDPSTMLFTGAVTHELLARNTPLFVQNEFLDNDVNKFTDLARSSSQVSWLAQATGGRMQESPRFRDILAPIDLGDEMRVTLMSRKSCWGVMCLHRERGSGNFTPEDAAFVSVVAPHIAEGLRCALLFTSAASEPLPGEPGLILLNDDLAIQGSTPAAGQWLQQLIGIEPRPDAQLPGVIYTVAARLLALERGDDEFDLPRAHLRSVSGGWIVVHGSRLSSPNGRGPIAILLEEAQPPEIATQIVKAYGLSQREGSVAQLVLRGHPTSEIAQGLFISTNTVQDHLKKIFEKVGVSSRRELMASVFANHYMPRIAAGSEVLADGWFKP